MIPFNIPLYTGKEEIYLERVVASRRFSGDGEFTKLCNQWIEINTQCHKALLTTSCTHAMEMASLLIEIQPGDEVIMPSFTFVSTANPFILRGAKIVFVDIRPDTMNIDECKIEEAITDKTKAIIPVHYAGISCEMDTIMDIARRHKLWVIEDAAQGILAYYKNRHLGSIGHMGCLSFHETKNIHCGEGGALMINDKTLLERAEIIREKGTNRSKFLRGEIDKYTWVDKGSSYLPSELNAAFLLAQFDAAQEITKKRNNLWNEYFERLKPLAYKGLIEIPYIPTECKHNGHIFYAKLRNINQRQKLITFLKTNKIYSVFHYVPLHSSEAGQIFGNMNGEDNFTTIDSDKLLRLPLYYDLRERDLYLISEMIIDFFANESVE